MLYNYFPVRIRETVRRALSYSQSIEEIRVRCGQNIIFCDSNGKWFVDNSGNLTKSFDESIKISKEDMKEMMKYITRNSVYAMQQDIKNGFVTLSDGTRVGLCGRCVVKNGKLENINNFSSFNIRLSRFIEGWGTEVFEKVGVCTKNVLVIAPPGYGKTTLLRNMIKFASDKGRNVSVVDEKCEISPMNEGVCVYELGNNTDILGDINKMIGIHIMIRTMNPEIIATDELLTADDFKALKNASLSGVNIYATFHGTCKEDYYEKAGIFGIDKAFFDCYILIRKNKSNKREIMYEMQVEK